MAKLSEKDKLILFDYLLYYEGNIKSNAGKYDMENFVLRRFLNDNNIFIAHSYNLTKLRKASTFSDYFVFDSKQNVASGTDVAHHLLRHIRNSIAHGLIHKEKRKFYVIKDKNKNLDENMSGKIRIDLFPSLIDALKQSKP